MRQFIKLKNLESGATDGKALRCASKHTLCVWWNPTVSMWPLRSNTNLPASCETVSFLWSHQRELNP